MPSKIELVKFILFYCGKNNLKPEQAIKEAQNLAMDIFDYLIFYQNIEEELVYKLGAKYCSLPFSPLVPRNLKITTQILRLDDLGLRDSFSAKLFDREIIFISPNSDKILALSEQIRAKNTEQINLCIVPKQVLRAALVNIFKTQLLTQSRQRLAKRWPFASAHLDLTIPARLLFLTIISLIIAIIIFTPLAYTPYLIPLLAVLFLLPAWFRISALFDLLFTRQRENYPLLNDEELPIYSILIPLRDEANMVEQLTRAMKNLDYPPHKLDIKFIVEQESPKTIRAVEQKLKTNPNFELIIVPPAPPHTKPKALDFALPMVRGKYLVIYDAEDIPQKSQLRLAATRFHYDLGIDCVQAELVIDNANDNWLTKLFAAEYSGLFGVMLPALSRWKFPMPLGGTSNHFRLSALYEVGGWDAFNVTEDADLGVRLSRLRYKTGTLNSCTYEEAPNNLKSWMAQRTRWMKGWMQTFIVHNRYGGHFLKDAGWKNFLAFQIYVGSLIISAPLHTIFLIAIIIRLILMGIEGFEIVDSWIFVHIFVLLAGYLATISHSVAGIIRLKEQKLSPILLSLPLYWALSGIASFLAAYELMVKPYFWAKTKHGLAKRTKRAELA